MKTIELDVEGLPEPLVQAIRNMVDALREQWNGKGDTRRPVDLLIKDGKVLTPLTREEIYEDV